MRTREMIPLLFLVVMSGTGWAAEQFYDLGGPCQDDMGLNVRGLNDAVKNGNWDRAVELEKSEVRAGCKIEFRWFQLVKVLLEAHRQQEAIKVVQEIDARGFDLNPSSVAQLLPEVKKFMDGDPAFQASPVGVKIEGLKKISDERRARFREALKAIPASERPPANYTAKGACPFECCRYGGWTVLKDTDLVAAPGSRRIVGKATKGRRVTGLTGEVHLTPEPVAVLRDGELPKDSIAFVLDYQGEGFGNVYTHGKILSIFVGVADYCFQLSESCWGESLLPAGQKKKPVWWVQVKLGNGLIGWTDKAASFGNMDGCGG